MSTDVKKPESKNATPFPGIELPVSSYAAETRLPDVQFRHHPPECPTVTPVVVVVLDRPQAKNAFTPDMARSLVTAFGLLSRDDRVKCVVLTGGDPQNRIFCAGADLTLGFRGGNVSTQDGPADFRDNGGIVSLAIYNCRKPVVAALNGSGVGIGITMTLGADIRVASSAPGAKYGFVFARRGIVMEACSSYFLPRLAGASAAVYLTTTGAALPASHKMLSPLFAEIVPPDDVLPVSLRLASEIAATTSTVSTRLMKDLVMRSADSPEEAHLRESALLYERFASADMREGVASFKEKRPPQFPGSLERGRLSTWPWWDTSVLVKADQRSKL